MVDNKKEYDDRGFHQKNASDHKPGVWAGKKDKVEFPEFANAVKNWADALHEDGAAMMEHYEVSKLPVVEMDMDKKKFPDIEKFSKKLYRQLVCCLTGEPQNFVKKCQAWNGNLSMARHRTELRSTDASG